MNRDEDICGRHIAMQTELQHDIDGLQYHIDELEKEFQEFRTELVVLDETKDESFNSTEFRRRSYIMYVVRENRKKREECMRLIAEKRRRINACEGGISYAEKSYAELLTKRKALSLELSRKYKK